MSKKQQMGNAEIVFYPSYYDTQMALCNFVSNPFNSQLVKQNLLVFKAVQIFVLLNNAKKEEHRQKGLFRILPLLFVPTKLYVTAAALGM